MDGWMDEWMSGWMGGCVDGWMTGWVDERVGGMSAPLGGLFGGAVKRYKWNSCASSRKQRTLRLVSIPGI